jgi:hypothetical protein
MKRWFMKPWFMKRWLMKPRQGFPPTPVAPASMIEPAIFTSVH